MTDSVRQRAIEVIRNRDQYTATELYKAVFDLYHNPKYGDEELLYPLLDHKDNWVAAGALYALCEVYGHRNQLRRLIFRVADGDPRDEGDNQLQFQALCLLGSLAKDGDQNACEKLWAVAEDPAANEFGRREAWYQLATLHGIEWQGWWTDEMVLRPFSGATEQIRQQIRQEILRRGGRLPARKSGGHGLE
ncbi:hypothetical protein [Thermopirellula anaerolimosa]